MKFRVKLCRNVYETAYVEIEGTDEDDVEEKVDEMDTESLESLEWQVDDRDEPDIDEIQQI